MTLGYCYPTSGISLDIKDEPRFKHVRKQSRRVWCVSVHFQLPGETPYQLPNRSTLGERALNLSTFSDRCHRWCLQPRKIISGGRSTIKNIILLCYYTPFQNVKLVLLILAAGKCSCCTTCSGCSMTCSQSQQQSSCDDSGNSVCSKCALLTPCAAAGLSSSYDASVDSNSEEGHEA